MIAFPQVVRKKHFELAQHFIFTNPSNNTNNRYCIASFWKNILVNAQTVLIQCKLQL